METLHEVNGDLSYKLKNVAKDEVRELHLEIFRNAQKYGFDPIIHSLPKNKINGKGEYGIVIMNGNDGFGDDWRDWDSTANETVFQFITPGSLVGKKFYPGIGKASLGGLIRSVTQPTAYTISRTAFPEIENLENVSLNGKIKPVYKNFLNLLDLSEKRVIEKDVAVGLEKRIMEVISDYNPKRIA